MSLVLAFDVEHSGTDRQCSIVGLSACVMDEDYTIMDTLFVKAFQEGVTHFEEDCYENFWSKHPDILYNLEIDHGLNFKQVQIHLIDAFQMFRQRWENIAKERKCSLHVVCDNAAFDAHHINISIEKYTSNKPILYRVSDGKYATLHDVYSWQLGVLSVLDPKFDSDNENASHKIRQLYKISPPPVEHDHDCKNDAINIAHDFQVLLNIKKGKYTTHTETY